MTIELVTFRSRKPIIAKKKKNVTFRFLSSPILTQIEIIIFQSKIVVDRSYFFIFVCYFFFQFLLGKLLSMLLFILSCRLELTAYYRKRTFSNSQATLHSFSEKCVTYHSRSPFNDTAQYISYKHDMHEPIRYVLDHLDEWQLIRYGSKVPRERIMWIEIYPHCCFCNDSTLFLIFSLIADEIYEFFLGWWILFFFIRQ